MAEKKIGVRISGHAKERFLERFPEDAEGRNVHSLIFAEVQSALAAGRKACNRPRWLSGDDHPRHKFTRKGTMRFCWNPEQTRCYAIVRHNGRGNSRRDEFDESWEVWTVMKPGFFEPRHPSLQARAAGGTIGGRA